MNDTLLPESIPMYIGPFANRYSNSIEHAATHGETVRL